MGQSRQATRHDDDVEDIRSGTGKMKIRRETARQRLLQLPIERHTFLSQGRINVAGRMTLKTGWPLAVQPSQHPEFILNVVMASIRSPAFPGHRMVMSGPVWPHGR